MDEGGVLGSLCSGLLVLLVAGDTPADCDAALDALLLEPTPAAEDCESLLPDS